MIPRWLPYIAAVALLIGAVWRGYSWGYGAAEADHAAELLAQIEAGQMLDAARRKLVGERDELANRLSEEAYADPIIVEHGLGPDRVRRLKALR